MHNAHGLMCLQSLPCRLCDTSVFHVITIAFDSDEFGQLFASILTSAPTDECSPLSRMPPLTTPAGGAVAAPA